MTSPLKDTISEYLDAERAPSVDDLFRRTETRAERRARRLADPYVAAKMAEQAPAFQEREAARIAASPKLDDMIRALEEYFGCDLLEVTREMVANSIFRAPTSEQEAIEREAAIKAQFAHNAEVMSPEFAEHIRSMGEQIIQQYREHGGEG